jgi:ribonuclease HI
MNRTRYSSQQHGIADAQGDETKRHSREAGDYLVRLLEWAWFVTFTFPGIDSKVNALARLRDYLGDLERAAQRPIGWAVVLEFEADSKFLHAHALIADVAHLYRYTWWKEAVRRFGRTQIRPFEDDEGGEYYVANHAVNGSGLLYVGGRLIAPKEDNRRVANVLVVRQPRSRPNPVASHRHQQQAAKKAGATTASKATRHRIYVSGSGMRPDGSGSRCAWLNVTTGKSQVVPVDGLTGNKSEWWSLIHAIESLPEGAEADLFSSSKLVVCQFNGEWAVRDFDLQETLKMARRMIRERHLKLTLRWVAQKQNPAARLP